MLQVKLRHVCQDKEEGVEFTLSHVSQQFAVVFVMQAVLLDQVWTGLMLTVIG